MKSSFAGMLSFILLLAVLPGMSAGQTVSPLECGARELGMGGAWIAHGEGIANVRGNPALIASLPRLSLQTGYLWQSGDMNTVFNYPQRPSSYTISTPVLYQHFPEELGIAMNQSGRLFSCTLAFHWQQRINDLTTQAQIDRSVAGELVVLTPAIAASYQHWLRVGASHSQVVGNRQTTLVGAVAVDGGVNFNELQSYPGGIQDRGDAWRFGAAADLSETHFALPVTLGFAYTPTWKLEISNFYMAPNSNNIKRPEQVAFGVAWQPRTWATLAGDVEHYGFSGLHEAYYIYNPSHQRETVFRGGAEVRLPIKIVQVAIRAGYAQLPPSMAYWIPFYNTTQEIPRDSNSSAATLGFSLGTSWGTFDFAWYRQTSETRSRAANGQTKNIICHFRVVETGLTLHL